MIDHRFRLSIPSISSNKNTFNTNVNILHTTNTQKLISTENREDPLRWSMNNRNDISRESRLIIRLPTFECKRFVPTGIEVSPFDFRREFSLLVRQKQDFDVWVTRAGHVFCDEVNGPDDLERKNQLLWVIAEAELDAAQLLASLCAALRVAVVRHESPWVVGGNDASSPAGRTRSSGRSSSFPVVSMPGCR